MRKEKDLGITADGPRIPLMSNGGVGNADLRSLPNTKFGTKMLAFDGITRLQFSQQREFLKKMKKITEKWNFRRHLIGIKIEQRVKRTC